MENKKPHIPISDPLLVRIQQLCLCMTVLGELLLFAFGDAFSRRFQFYRLACFASAGLFCAVTLLQLYRRKTAYPFLPGLLMTGWFLFVCYLHKTNLSFSGDSLGLFLSVYLVALPFARVTGDENRLTGLKIMALLFVAVSLLWAVYGIMLKLECLPEPLQACVIWDGARLKTILHPNVTARFFMIGIAFCFMLCLRTRSKWLQAALLAAAVLIFAAQALTNSRAAMLVTCLLAAATAFLLIAQGGWKRLAAGTIAALLIFCALFFSSQALFSRNADHIIAQILAEQREEREALKESSGKSDSKSSKHSDSSKEKKKKASSSVLITSDSALHELPGVLNPQGTFLGDLPTLNNRTGIWLAALNGIRDNPSILLVGTDQPGLLVEEALAVHSHNAWLEVLIRLGLPGLLLSLVFTVQTIHSSFLLLLRRTENWKKLLALLMLSLLVCSMLEPSLFHTLIDWHFLNYLFFLLLGYIQLWAKQPVPKT